MCSNVESLYEKTDSDFKIKILEAKNINNKKFSRHVHESLCIGVVERNIRGISFKEEHVFCEPNSLFVINPLEVHSCIVNNDLPHNYRIISIESDFLKELLKDAYKIKYDRYFKIRLIKDKILLYKFNTLFNYIKNNAQKYDKESNFYSFLNALYRYSILKDNVEVSPNIVIKTKKFIEENLTEDIIDLDCMARNLSLSKFHFHRIFTKNVGITPYEYFIHAKIRKAKELLLIKRLTIIDATYELGFFDQSHFTKYFKRIIGITPRNFIKSNDFMSAGKV